MALPCLGKSATKILCVSRTEFAKGFAINVTVKKLCERKKETKRKLWRFCHNSVAEILVKQR